MEFQLAILFCFLAIIGNAYLLHLHFNNVKTKRKNSYKKEMKLFLSLMKRYGLSHEEAKEVLLEYKDYYALKKANKKAKKYV